MLRICGEGQVFYCPFFSQVFFFNAYRPKRLLSVALFTRFSSNLSRLLAVWHRYLSNMHMERVVGLSLLIFCIFPRRSLDSSGWSYTRWDIWQWEKATWLGTLGYSLLVGGAYLVG